MSAVMHFVISYAVACWYFTPCVNDGHYSKPFGKPGPDILRKGFYAAFRYHLGSLALGAFIVALFRIVQGVLEIVAKYAKETGNPVAATLAHACMCCVWCFEEILRFINKNAIIEMVLKSKDFFSSAGGAIKTLASASTEVAGLNGVTFIFQILGVFSISAMCAGLAHLMVTHAPMYTSKESDYFLDVPMVVVVAAGIIGLVVGSAYMFIFDMVSDTLLFCWLTDNEDGVTEFAPEPLRNLIGHPKRAKGGKNTAY